MNKKLSPKTCILMAIGGMVGSSIFTLSGVTYMMAGSAAILTWGLAGIILLLYALNIAELATTFPKSGGIYVYPSKIIGQTEKGKHFAGWISAWSWLNVSIFGTTFSAICVSNYLSSFVPQIAENKILQIVIPIAWIILVWFLNARSADSFGQIHNKITFVLLFILGVYIILGFINGNFKNMTPFVSGTMGKQGVIAGIPIAMLGYGSIIAVASFGGEIENPKKNIPRIMISAVLSTVLVYLLILLSTFRMANVESMTEAGATYYPLAFALGEVMKGSNSWVVVIVPLAALFALTTNMSIMIMDAGRTLMATAQSGFLPQKWGVIDEEKQTPIAALNVIAIVCIILSLKPEFIGFIIGAGSICSAITVAIISITLLTLRKKQKTGEIKNSGEFRVPGEKFFPLITMIVIAITLVLLYMGEGGYKAFIVAGIWYLIGIIIYFVKEKR